MAHRMIVIGVGCLAAASLFLTPVGRLVHAADTPVFKAGFAETDITPDLGMEHPGGYGKSFHSKRHDPCKARAVVFDDGSTRVALVGVDACFLRRPSVAAARKLIREKCGILEENVMIAASHSHAAGPTGMVLPGEYDHASDFVKTLAYEKSSMANAEYLKRVESQIAAAVVAANDGRVEARAAAGFGHEDKASYNRRFRMKNGLCMTHPRPGNPDIVEPAGPIDPQVGVVGVWNKEGEFLGCVVNFACHATTGPGGISADWIYYLEKTIRGLMGEKANVVFLPGAGGDVTQVDNRTPYQVRQFGEISGRYVGGRVGAEAVRTLLDIEQHAGPLVPLATRREVLKIKRRVPRPERVTKSTELAQKDPKTVDATEWTFAKEIVMLDAILQKEPVQSVEVQAVQVGPAVWLSNPSEYFCQYGLDIKKGSRFPFTFPVSLANDCVGYVPTEEALGPRGGGYETRLTAYSNLEPTAGTQIANRLIGFAKELKPGPVPAAQPIPREFKGGGWTYGSLPPELD